MGLATNLLSAIVTRDFSGPIVIRPGMSTETGEHGDPGAAARAHAMVSENTGV